MLYWRVNSAVVFLEPVAPSIDYLRVLQVRGEVAVPVS